MDKMTDVERVRDMLKKVLKTYANGTYLSAEALLEISKLLSLLDKKVLVDAIPLADKENMSYGWTVDYDSINAITNQARIVNMEEVEAVIMAMTDLGYAYLTAAEEVEG